MTYFASDLPTNSPCQVVATRNPDIGMGPFDRQRYSNPALGLPIRQALTTRDPERRQVLTHQAARALLEDKGVPPVIFLRNTRAGRRDRVVYDPSPVNHASAVHARPPN